MAQRAFLKVDGVPGSSPETGHIGEIEVIQFQYDTKGVAQQSKQPFYPGRGPSVGFRIRFVKEMDASTSILRMKMANRTPIGSATLTIENQRDGKVVPVAKLEMTGIKVSKAEIRQPTAIDPHSQGIPNLEEILFICDRVTSMIYSTKIEDSWKD